MRAPGRLGYGQLVVGVQPPGRLGYGCLAKWVRAPDRLGYSRQAQLAVEVLRWGNFFTWRRVYFSRPPVMVASF